MIDDTPGKRRARALLKKNPNFFVDIGGRGGRATQERYGEKVQNFRNPTLAKEAGLRGLKTQGRKV